jgi:hypothetical protein
MKPKVPREVLTALRPELRNLAAAAAAQGLKAALQAAVKVAAQRPKEKQK